MGMIDMSEGEADYFKYRFKQYLGSVSREIQNRRLKEQEMGMSIDKIIQGIEVVKAQAEWEYPLDWQILLDDTKEIICKYQIMQAEYEARLKADMFAMLGMIRQDLSDKLAEEKGTYHISDVGIGLERAINTVDEYMARIEEALKGDKEE